MSNELIPKLDAIREEKLLEVAHQRFSEDLSDSEKKVLSDSAHSGFPDAPGENFVPPLVGSKFLRWVVCDEEAHRYIDPRGLRVYCATIADELNIGDCVIPFPLDFRGCLFFETLSLVAAETRQITLFECQTMKGVSADRLITNGSLILRGLKSWGEIRLPGANIGGNFDCSGSRIQTSGNAINLDRAIVQGDFLLKPFPNAQPTRRFISTGSIHMNGASIKGDFDCSRAILRLQDVNLQTCALYLDRAMIVGSVHLSTGFRANRGIRAVDTSIGGSLECRAAHLAGRDAALNLNRAVIGGSLFLDGDFHSSGTIFLNNAQVKHDLSCMGASLGKVNCEGMKLGGDLIWTSISDANNVTKYLNISSANIKNIHDDTGSWPKSGRLAVDGSKYEDLIAHEPSTKEHLKNKRLAPRRKLNSGERASWLNLQNDEDRLDPQAWMWLAKLFKEKDDIVGYRQIVCEYRCMKVRSSRNPITRSVGIPMAHLERNPWSILWLFLPLLIIGALVFWLGASARVMAPTNKDAYSAWATNERFPLAYPRFNPLVYTLENELPLVKFGMDDKWAPDPNLIVKGDTGTYWSLSIFRWFLILAGWVQGIMLTIGINRRFRD